MILKDVLQKSINFFKSKGVEGARWEAESLLAHGLNWERIHLYMKGEYPLTPQELQSCRDLIKFRGQGIPTAYLVGYKNFYKSKFKVGRGVLIPRSDSEVLVEKLLDVVPADSSSIVMDWGCGSGCLGLSLLLERPQMTLVAVDSMEAPALFTRVNGEDMGVSSRVHVLTKSVEDLSEQDIVARAGAPSYLICNPPYIGKEDPLVEASVVDHEPHSALFSEDGGQHHLKSWITKALTEFPSLQHMIFEIGANQAYAMEDFLAAYGESWTVELFKDLGGRDRALRISRR